MTTADVLDLAAEHCAGEEPTATLARAYILLAAAYECQRAAKRKLAAQLLLRACEFEALREGPEDCVLELMASRLEFLRRG